MSRFCVVGAGVSGLTTAVVLAEAGHDVEVWTALDPLDTTSVVAAAIWEPAFQEPQEQTVGWANRSYARFERLADDPATGVQLVIVVYTEGQMPPEPWPMEVRAMRWIRPSLASERPASVPSALSALVPLIDMPRYLTYLQDRLIERGGHIARREVRDLAEAAHGGRTVINCTGLGARRLVGDPTMTPEFGQHVEVRNPGLVHAFTAPGPDENQWVSWYPHGDRLVLGGVRIAGREDTTPIPAVSERILARAQAIETRLRGCEITRVRAGLRPVRPQVRLEADGPGLIHNYGHGWAGITLSWGCAQAVLDLVG